MKNYGIMKKYKSVRFWRLETMQNEQKQLEYEAAEILRDKQCWEMLAEEALRQGCPSLVEVGYQRSHNWQKLSFIYLCTGNLPKLKQMQQM